MDENEIIRSRERSRRQQPAALKNFITNQKAAMDSRNNSEKDGKSFDKYSDYNQA